MHNLPNLQLQNTNEMHPILLDLNINAKENFVIDLNIILNYPARSIFI